MVDLAQEVVTMTRNARRLAIVNAVTTDALVKYVATIRIALGIIKNANLCAMFLFLVVQKFAQNDDVDNGGAA